MSRTRVFIILLAVLLALPSSLFERFDHFGPGNRDLISFWSACQLFLAQENPYHEGALSTLQTGVETTKVTWNPPWFLLLLAPILGGSLGRATMLFLLLNIGAFLAIALLSNRNWQKPLVLAPALLFFPVLQTLQYGQSSLLLTLFVTLSLWSFLNRRDFVSGMSLGLLSIKPHLVLGYGIALGVLALRERRWFVPLGAVGCVLLLAVVSFVVSPESLSFWFEKLTHPQEGQSVLDWKTATLATPIREWLGGAPLVVPLFLLLSVALALFVALRVRGETGLLLALCASVGLSPYGWVFDSVLFLPALFVVLRERSWRVPSLLGSVLLLFLGARFIERQDQFFFLPSLCALVLGSALFVRAAKRNSEEQCL